MVHVCNLQKKKIQNWSIFELIQDALGNENGQTWSWHLPGLKVCRKGGDLTVDILHFYKYFVISNTPQLFKLKFKKKTMHVGYN